ncbi:Uncharacterized membrane-anchored protein [Anaerobranca californiensis DSM 14826]|jgi:uncharacterized membrane-anchored protein|uniref:Uncharacterized membrane-anchored protein n=1 Tax=Anaerobranca californiensis DSM 14826 TaxID=1120989 RepID=A0A1M6L5M6_9FIRM|nr:putative cytokinetic ring protein SteA [Anaerobranca californiensis]SHJ66502.1 Uncharacterized membrane-anchored protein [Anaerobranca californiensis DSM 14826]
MNIKGIIKKNKKTKDLIKELEYGDIALICHKDIDEIAALGLIEKKVKAVINIEQSISGFYPNQGPKLLLEKGIILWDNVDKRLWDKITDETEIEIIENKIIGLDGDINLGKPLTIEDVEKKLAEAEDNFNNVLDDFIDNTLTYAKREKSLVTGKLQIPPIDIDLKDKPVVVLVRGKSYKEDLLAIRSFIKEVKPILIAVDGGADAFLEHRLKPDIIVGDMDSVSDEALKMAKELIVHGYPDGRAPGLDRLKSLGLEGKVFKAPGTSEDIALLLAYHYKAEIIVALGTHSNMIDFLEKGRKGMASTFLVRLKVGPKLVDGKGVSVLYNSSINTKTLVLLVIGMFLPFLVMAYYSPTVQQLIRLFIMRLKYSF